MAFASATLRSISMLSLSVCLVGCGGAADKPQLGVVKGVITMNDKPLPDVTVTFEPQSKGAGSQGSQVGAGSTGVTNAAGQYELTYNDGKSKGAVVGDHVVRIASASGGGPAGGANAAAIINIPPIYNSNSNLKAQVKPEENVHDFKLTAKSPR